MEKKIQYILCICAVAVVIILYMSMQNDVKRVEYDLKANVTDIRINDSKMLLGVSNDINELNFGAIPVNVSPQKFLDLKNNEPTQVLIEIHIDGNISEYIGLTDENFILDSGDAKQVGLTFYATKKGIYKGKIYVDAIIPTYKSLAFISLWKSK